MFCNILVTESLFCDDEVDRVIWLLEVGLGLERDILFRFFVGLRLGLFIELSCAVFSVVDNIWIWVVGR